MEYTRRLIWFWVKIIIGLALLIGLFNAVFKVAAATATIRIIAEDGFSTRAEQMLMHTDAEESGVQLNMFFTEAFLSEDTFYQNNPYANDVITDYNYELNIETLWVDPLGHRATLTVVESLTDIQGTHNTGEQDEEGNAVVTSPDPWPSCRYELICVQVDGNWYIDQITASETLPPEPTPTPETSMQVYGVINADSANIRNGAGTIYSRVATLKKDTRVEILDEDNGWYHIKTDTIEGYVSKRLVDVEE